MSSYGSLDRVKTIALGSPRYPGRVQIWCNYERHPNHIDLHVINGAWDGRFYPDGNFLVVNETGHRFEAEILWEGHVHGKAAYDYNNAINWIERQIRSVYSE